MRTESSPKKTTMMMKLQRQRGLPTKKARHWDTTLVLQLHHHRRRSRRYETVSSDSRAAQGLPSSTAAQNRVSRIVCFANRRCAVSRTISIDLLAPLSGLFATSIPVLLLQDPQTSETEDPLESREVRIVRVFRDINRFSPSIVRALR